MKPLITKGKTNPHRFYERYVGILSRLRTAYRNDKRLFWYKSNHYTWVKTANYIFVTIIEFEDSKIYTYQLPDTNIPSKLPRINRKTLRI